MRPYTVHMHPPLGTPEVPCCGLLVAALPPGDRVTLHPDRVTCHPNEEAPHGS